MKLALIHWISLALALTLVVGAEGLIVVHQLPLAAAASLTSVVFGVGAFASRF